MRRRDFFERMGAGACLIGWKPDALERLAPAFSAARPRTAEALAADEDFWLQIRHAFTIDPNQINLNSGSVSPAPRVVQEAEQQYNTIVNMSPSFWADEMLYPELEMVRGRLAGLFGCDAEELAITRNTSESLQIVQFGLRLEPGDEVLTTTQDYPRMLTTWEQRARRDGIVLRAIPIPTPAEHPDQLTQLFEQAITPRTRVIHFSHITYTAGQIFPVRALCRMARARGIRTIVDGAHAFAHFPFTRDELECDFFGTSLHKWLTAPFGTGFLYVRRELIPEVWPLMAAPASMDADIRKFEQIGTHPVANRNAIGEAIAFNEYIGIDRKAARLRYLRQRWTDQVRDLPGVQLLTSDDPAQSCAIGTVRLAGVGAQELTDALWRRHRIHVRPRFVPGEWEGVRVTPNVFTTVQEVDAFAAAIEGVARRGLNG
ncbi:MAG: aminotransferase class V-fold PLP-dependent enzyme [Rhodothermales bacterium]